MVSFGWGWAENSGRKRVRPPESIKLDQMSDLAGETWDVFAPDGECLKQVEAPLLEEMYEAT